MKEGDLVTLSTYALMRADMYKWKHRIWHKKMSLVGLVVRVEDNPYAREHTSKNERRFYFIKWMQKEGPASRWGTHGYHASTTGYFLRNDLKFVK